MANRSGGTWAVLALALAVPVVLFYGWWSKMDAAKKKELNQKIRSRGVTAFASTGRNKEKLENPLEGQQPQDAPLPPSAAPVASTETAPAVAAAPVTPAPMPEAAPAPESTPGPVPQPAPSDVPAAEVAASSMSAGYYLTVASMPKRDPTISPYDQVRLTQRKLEEELRAAELKAMLEGSKVTTSGGKIRRVKKVEEPMPNIDLQGIISTPDGDYQAIVNDNLVRQGDMTGNGKVKVVRISPQSVIFEWKKKRFTRSVIQ